MTIVLFNNCKMMIRQSTVKETSLAHLTVENCRVTFTMGCFGVPTVLIILLSYVNLYLFINQI